MENKVWLQAVYASNSITDSKDVGATAAVSSGCSPCQQLHCQAFCPSATWVSWALSGRVCLSVQQFPLTFAAHTAHTEPSHRHLDTESIASPRPIVQMPSATEWTLLSVIAVWRPPRSSSGGEHRPHAIQCPYSRAAANKNLIPYLSWGENWPTPQVRPVLCSANKPPLCCCTPSIMVINGFSICRGISLALLDCCIPTRQSQLVRSLDDV